MNNNRYYQDNQDPTKQNLRDGQSKHHHHIEVQYSSVTPQAFQQDRQTQAQSFDPTEPQTPWRDIIPSSGKEATHKRKRTQDQLLSQTKKSEQCTELPKNPQPTTDAILAQPSSASRASLPRQYALESAKIAQITADTQYTWELRELSGPKSPSDNRAKENFYAIRDEDQLHDFIDAILSADQLGETLKQYDARNNTTFYKNFTLIKLNKYEKSTCYTYINSLITDINQKKRIKKRILESYTEKK